MIRRSHRAGFTLIETVLAMTLLGILVAVGALAFTPVLDIWSIAGPRNEVTDSASYGLSRLSYEIAQVRDTASVLTAQSNRFRFTDVSNNTIDYQLSGTHLMRNNDILARNVQSLAFTYYDKDNNVLVSPTISPTTTIMRIQIQTTSLLQGQSVILQSQVRPRNFPRGGS